MVVYPQTACPNLKSEEVKKLPKIKKTSHSSENSLISKVQSEFKSNQSYLNLSLGLIIVLVVGILVFNYFKKDESGLGPAQETALTDETTSDVTVGDLPGKYTVKEGDTLFEIAQKYYQDGFKFPKLVEVNKLANANLLTVGQVLDIPKIEEATSSDVIAKTVTEDQSGEGTGGATNLTIWGEKITGNSYTVVEGDWLSKIAGRAYGDIMAYEKIAQANNISDPNLIEPGTVLKIPR